MYIMLFDILYVVDFRSMFTHQYLIDKLPNMLIFHLMRFSQNGRKDNHHISFPLILDMGPYCCDGITDEVCMTICDVTIL